MLNFSSARFLWEWVHSAAAVKPPQGSMLLQASAFKQMGAIWPEDLDKDVLRLYRQVAMNVTNHSHPPWKWRQYVPAKRRYKSIILHGVKIQGNLNLNNCRLEVWTTIFTSLLNNTHKLSGIGRLLFWGKGQVCPDPKSPSVSRSSAGRSGLTWLCCCGRRCHAHTSWRRMPCLHCGTYRAWRAVS